MFNLLIIATFIAVNGAKPPSCDDILSTSTTFTGTCTNKWKNLQPLLRPTQSSVGWAWVQRKLDKDFDDEDEAQDEMDGSPVPAIIGPGDMLYAVDHHHTLVALDLSGYHETKVKVDVLCDLRDNSTDFWTTMEERNYVYLLSAPTGPTSLPVTIAPNDLPQSFSSDAFSDDWGRSLASFVRKVKNSTCSGDEEYCMRCYDRICEGEGGDTPFFEFRWGYFFNDVTFGEGGAWPSYEERTEFLKVYESCDTSSKIGEVDVDGWEDAAEKLIPLCREGSLAVGYELPNDVLGGGRLPGAIDGWEKLKEDPTCASPAPC